MAGLAQDLLALALTLLLSLAQFAWAMDEFELDDGWQSWDVPAGNSGQRACCYHVRQGQVGVEGCRLDRGTGGLTIDSDCEPTSDVVRIYVRLEDGEVTDIRALSAACPVVTATPARELGARSPTDSLAWLDRHARGNSELAEEAVTAMAMHDDATAFAALKALVEDRGRDMKVREQALFWLAQSGSEQAFRYLDGLLSAR